MTQLPKVCHIRVHMLMAMILDGRFDRPAFRGRFRSSITMILCRSLSRNSGWGSSWIIFVSFDELPLICLIDMFHFGLFLSLNGFVQNLIFMIVMFALYFLFLFYYHNLLTII